MGHPVDDFIAAAQLTEPAKNLESKTRIWLLDFLESRKHGNVLKEWESV